MKNKFLVLVIFAVVSVNVSGYTKTNFPTTHNSKTLYYGADLTLFPPEVRDWIMNKAFSRDKMEKPFMLDPKLKVWWGEDGNSILTEASYTIAEGYVGAGTIKKWGNNTKYSGGNLDKYGEYAKYHTLKFKWELKQEVELQLQHDPAYAEIIAFSKMLCEEIEYDWANFSGYMGPVKRTPNKKYFVCEDYTNEVMDRILELNCVQSVQKWSSSDHAWNVIKLVDGRILYLDLTWFDNESINKNTGEIYQKDDYDWENITFCEDLFRYSNVGYSSKVFHHAIGKFVKEIAKE